MSGIGRRLVWGWLVCMLPLAQAGELRVHVGDVNSVAVADAVVSLSRIGGNSAVARKAPAVMDQHDLRFVPFVLPIQVGTAVTFPNSDNVRHQVYSFSPAKRFELSLYAGNHTSSVLFNQPGIVTIGCNIHDWMVGYVIVLDTPYFAKTGSDGVARVNDVPAGVYEVHLWHPRIDGAAARVVDEHLVLTGAPMERSFQLKLGPPDQSNVPPAGLEMGLGHRMHPHGT
ncbi:MAG: methylamine utilization protein [Rhodanobacter sp.]